MRSCNSPDSASTRVYYNIPSLDGDIPGYHKKGVMYSISICILQRTFLCLCIILTDADRVDDVDKLNDRHMKYCMMWSELIISVMCGHVINIHKTLHNKYRVIVICATRPTKSSIYYMN